MRAALLTAALVCHTASRYFAHANGCRPLRKLPYKLPRRRAFAKKGC